MSRNFKCFNFFQVLYETFHVINFPNEKRKHYKGKNRKLKTNSNSKTLKATSFKISQALRKKNRDAGNISVYFASETPKKYFTEKEIHTLSG